MRQLHPATIHEKFVASGIYKAGDAVIEQWRIHELPDASWLIRVDCEAKGAEGYTLLIEALYGAHRQAERFDLRVYQRRGDVTREGRATYTFFDGRVIAVRTIDRDEHQRDEQDLPPDTVVYPPAWVFSGLALTQIAGRESALVYTVNLEDVAGVGWLHGQVEQRQIDRVGDKTLSVAGKSHQAAGYKFIDDSRVYWVDAHGMLVQCESEQEAVIVLTQYARRPDVTGS